MKLLSVNIASAKPITIAERSFETGIYKEAVAQAFIHELGLEGDTVSDKKHHGGPDQAVYLYSQEDYDYWAEQLNEPLKAGTFGENLTVSSFGTSDIKIGDRFIFQNVILEVSSPRIPCSTLAKRMNDMSFAKTFRQARKPGVYTRVIQTGLVVAGEAFEFEASQEDNPSLAEYFELFYEKNPSVKEMKRFLAAPIDIRGKTHYTELLEKAL